MKKALKYEIYNKKGEMYYEFIVELVDNAVTAYIIAPLTDNDLHPFYIERLSL